MTLRLSDLPVGEPAWVEGVTNPDPVGLRVLEMGLTPGTCVEILGLAPLGDPLLVSVRGYRLSLRRSEAARIRVRRDLPAPGRRPSGAW
jgi:ferrous iron transport protein A